MKITKIFASLLLLCVSHTGCSLPSCTLNSEGTLSLLSYSVNDEDIESGDLADCFDNFGRENIVTLYLSAFRNYFTSMPGDMFEGMVNLEHISIESNGLTEIPDDLFEDLSTLKYIRLSENYDLTIQDGVFDGLDSLEELVLSDCNFDSLPEGIFQGLTSLVTLHLQGNEFRTLPDGIFEGLTSLEFLDISENELTELSSGIFSDLESLLELRIDDNFLLCYPQSFAREIIADEGDSECEGGFDEEDGDSGIIGGTSGGLSYRNIAFDKWAIVAVGIMFAVQYLYM